MKFLIIQFLVIIYSHTICDRKTLIQELREDLKINQKLMCSRYFQQKNIIVSEKDINEYKKAIWDSNCSFESHYGFLKIYKEFFKIQNIYDQYGQITDQELTDQEAALCVIIRSIFTDKNIKLIGDEDYFDFIECAGQDDNQICAVNIGSPNQKYAWTFLLKDEWTYIDFKQQVR